VEAIKFTILGEAASKANQRKLVTIGGKPRLIKSKKARDFMSCARQQVPPAARVRLQGPVAVRLHMFYATERPDLDESVVLDALQDHYAKPGYTSRGQRVRELVQSGVYCNDRQVRWKLVVHHIDRRNPRCEVEVVSIAPTEDLFVAMPFDEPMPF
jgi:Holliday junction resolvase RusA-like endonuclease